MLEVVTEFGNAAGFPVNHSIGERRDGDLGETYCVPTKAKEILGWEARYTLADMCAHAWKWAQQNPKGYEKSAEALALSES